MFVILNTSKPKYLQVVSKTENKINQKETEKQWLFIYSPCLAILCSFS